MNKSESIINLVTALSKLQNEIQNAYKDKHGYGYKYVELSSILDSCRPLLSKHELAVSQLCENSSSEPDVVGVETVLMHSSGQYISSTLYMKVDNPIGKSGKPSMSMAQAAGSVITYARRYALAAILGVAQTDNDASIKDEAPDKQLPSNHYITLTSLISDRRLEDKVAAWCKHYKVSTLADLNEAQTKQLINRIEEAS